MAAMFVECVWFEVERGWRRSVCCWVVCELMRECVNWVDDGSLYIQSQAPGAMVDAFVSRPPMRGPPAAWDLNLSTTRPGSAPGRAYRPVKPAPDCRSLRARPRSGIFGGRGASLGGPRIGNSSPASRWRVCLSKCSMGYVYLPTSNSHISACKLSHRASNEILARSPISFKLWL